MKQRRPGTQYVQCIHCQKDISHSNIAAHVRKAHPDKAKPKRLRRKTVRPSPSSSFSEVSATGAVNTNATIKNESLPSQLTDTSRTMCVYCKGMFSRAHLVKHIKNKHPVESTMDYLVKRVVFETEFFQPYEMSKTLKRPAPSEPISLLISRTTECAQAVAEIQHPGDHCGSLKKIKVDAEGADKSNIDTKKERVRKHTYPVPEKCNYCGVTLSKRNMKVHLRNMHPQSVSDGNGKVTTSGAISIIREKNDRFPTVVCQYCNKEITKKSIRAHIRNIHPEYAGNERTTHTPRTVSCPTTQCKYCNKTITKKSIRAHVRNLHPEAVVEELLSSSENVVQNQLVGNTALLSSTEAAKNILNNKEELSVICQYCQLPIPKNEILEHVRVQHERTSATQCKYCPKQIQIRNMNTHVRKYHVVESVVEALVTKVVSLNSSQPVVAPVDYSIPVSRLLSLNNKSSSSTAVPSVTSSMPTTSSRGGQFLGTLGQSRGSSGCKGKEGTAKIPKRKVIHSNDINPKRRKRLQDDFTPSEDFSNYKNLDLLATFAASMQPIST